MSAVVLLPEHHRGMWLQVAADYATRSGLDIHSVTGDPGAAAALLRTGMVVILCDFTLPLARLGVHIPGVGGGDVAGQRPQRLRPELERTRRTNRPIRTSNLDPGVR